MNILKRLSLSRFGFQLRFQLPTFSNDHGHFLAFAHETSSKSLDILPLSQDFISLLPQVHHNSTAMKHAHIHMKT